MHIRAAQKAVDRWIKQSGGYWQADRILRKLHEEVNEAAAEIAKLRSATPAERNAVLVRLEDEGADVFFALMCLFNAHKLHLTNAFRRMMRERRYGRNAKKPKTEK